MKVRRLSSQNDIRFSVEERDLRSASDSILVDIEESQMFSGAYSERFEHGLSMLLYRGSKLVFVSNSIVSYGFSETELKIIKKIILKQEDNHSLEYNFIIGGD